MASQRSNSVKFLPAVGVALILIFLEPLNCMELSRRVKKHASDQRLADLQALIALNNMQDGHGEYGHGHIDPYAVGRRRRFVDSAPEVDVQSSLYSTAEEQRAESKRQERFLYDVLRQSVERRKRHSIIELIRWDQRILRPKPERTFPTK